MAVVTVTTRYGIHMGELPVPYHVGDTGEDTILKYGIYAAPVVTPTTPAQLRYAYGRQWNIPSQAIPVLTVGSDRKVTSSRLGEDDLILCGVTVEFFVDRPNPSPQTPPKWNWKWWR